MHAAQPDPLARRRRTLHIKTLISDKATFSSESAGCTEQGWGNTKRFFQLLLGFFPG